jgi:hypothetical protein
MKNKIILSNLSKPTLIRLLKEELEDQRLTTNWLHYDYYQNRIDKINKAINTL